jgi:hypothetical protein
MSCQLSASSGGHTVQIASPDVAVVLQSIVGDILTAGVGIACPNGIEIAIQQRGVILRSLSARQWQATQIGTAQIVFLGRACHGGVCDGGQTLLGRIDVRIG